MPFRHPWIATSIGVGVLIMPVLLNMHAREREGIMPPALLLMVFISLVLCYALWTTYFVISGLMPLAPTIYGE